MTRDEIGFRITGWKALALMSYGVLAFTVGTVTMIGWIA